MAENDIEKLRKQIEGLKKASMNLGTVLGLYYAVKFFLFPLGLTSGIAGMLFIGLTLLVPVLAYKLTKRYRQSLPDGFMSYMQAWTFVLRLFFFASLLVAVVHYVYFAFMDKGALLQALTYNLEQMRSTSVDGVTNQASWQAQLELFQESLNNIASMTPIKLVMELFINNLFWGALLAVPIAAINVRKSFTPSK